jgi:hypothetical protein
MMMGACSSSGSLKWLWRMNTGSWSPAFAAASQPLHTPWCTRPVAGMTSRTTEQVTCTEPGWRVALLLME